MKYVLRTLTALAFLGGIALCVIAFADFFSTVGSMQGPPQRFWLFFAGFPLIGIGGVLLAFSKRYDAIELLRAQRQAPTLTSPQHPKYCAYCGQLLEERARYCPNCGAPCSSDL